MATSTMPPTYVPLAYRGQPCPDWTELQRHLWQAAHAAHAAWLEIEYARGHSPDVLPEGLCDEAHGLYRLVEELAYPQFAAQE